ASGLLEEDARRRGLQDERERAVRVDRDHDRDDHVAAGSLGVELLAEAHDVDAVLTERGPDRRRRGRLAGPKRQFDLSGDFLRHVRLSSSYEGLNVSEVRSALVPVMIRKTSCRWGGAAALPPRAKRVSPPAKNPTPQEWPCQRYSP